jgi:dTMP kinase
LLITFEGIEGSGKSTQLERLADRWREAAGGDVVTTREPGATGLGRSLRRLLLRVEETPLDPWAELLLYVADRAQHLTEVVLPALAGGRTVLCDRYLDATLAYQGHGRGLDLDAIRDLHRRPPLDLRPRRTLLFDLDPGAALRRARLRDSERGATIDEGRFEAERLEFHERVRAGYLELAAAEPDRFRVVDAGGDMDRVTERVEQALADLLEDTP